jgi:phosphatidylglycerophosphate synthase
MEPDRRTEAPALPPGSGFFSLANVLSLARVPLGVAFWLTLSADRRAYGIWLPFTVLGAAALTDVLDGYFARRAHADGPTGVGSWLDPICDKIFVACVLGAIYVVQRPPLSLLALIMSRELIQLPMSLVYRLSPVLRHWVHYDFRASVLGKAATVLQFVAVAALLLRWESARLLAWLTLVVGLAAIADYVRRAVVLARARR